MKLSTKLLASAVAATLCSAPVVADSALETLMTDSKTNVDFRYRYEGVDQEGIAETAAANTLRSRVTFNSGSVNNVSFKLEMDNVSALGGEQYNSTVNGRGEYPVVADPTGTDFNQAFVAYKNGSFGATAGRQRILLDDQRFVGGVGWRQNEQTYDGLSLAYSSGAVKGSYSFINNVNRIFGPTGPNADLRGAVHLANATFSVSDAHKLTGFAYLMDFDNAAAISSNTLGVRYAGDLDVVKLTASYATQSETGDNPTAYTASFLQAGANGKLSNFSWNIGYENLGSDDGNKAFATPLATLHKWQGWADKFLNTPSAGLQDIYFGAGTNIGKVKLSATYHTFSSDVGSVDLGTELDAVAIYPINKKVKALFKYANYSAQDNLEETSLTDTQKVWLMLQVSL
ncbi:alginate export family protein [Teredinibacter franksiae]|uniref:alginate export family protein n=1 Tax=Teredinibacter franksiae TaxID=2761453 RepID=UPI00162A352E|nr:alginate export family protein [Teredinibacter franksiae]